MALTKLFNRLGLAALVALLSCFATGCSDKDDVLTDVVVGSGTVSGTVTDENNQPLSGVTVTDLSSTKSTVSSGDGQCYTTYNKPATEEIKAFLEKWKQHLKTNKKVKKEAA